MSRPPTLEAVVARTPCARPCGPLRKKPSRDDSPARRWRSSRSRDVRYFFYIGGNDSAETAHLLNEVAVEEGYDVRLFHVPKTIDNDLRETDHCPGYGSAAKLRHPGALIGDNEDNRGLGGRQDRRRSWGATPGGSPRRRALARGGTRTRGRT